MSRYRLRYLPTDPYGRAGHTVTAWFLNREQAETVRRACPNAEHIEVIEEED